MPEWAWPSSGIVYLFALLATSQQQQLKNLMRFTVFNRKKISKIRQILRMKKIRKIRILDLCLQQPFRLSETATLS